MFDLPSVLAVAEEVIERQWLKERVDTSPGDYRVDALPRGFDLVLVSDTLHQEDEESCLRILKEARSSLIPGGICVIHAMPLNETQDGPLWPALHNLLMLLVYRGGRAYTVGQYCDQLLAAGFENPVHQDMSTYNAGSYIVAVRP